MIELEKYSNKPVPSLWGRRLGLICPSSRRSTSEKEEPLDRQLLQAPDLNVEKLLRLGAGIVRDTWWNEAAGGEEATREV